MSNMVLTFKKNASLVMLVTVACYAAIISISFLGNLDLEWEWVCFSAAQGIIRTGLPEVSGNGGELLICHVPLIPYVMAISM